MKIIKGKNIILFIGFIVVLNLLYPSPFEETLSLKVGTVAPRDIIAPQSFYIKKKKEVIEKEKEEARKKVFFVLKKEKEVGERVIRKISQFFDTLRMIKKEKIPTQEKRAKILRLIEFEKKEMNYILWKEMEGMEDSLIQCVKEMFTTGVIDSVEKEKIQSPVVVIFKEEIPRQLEEFVSLPKEIIKERGRKVYRDSVLVNIFVKIGSKFIEPNLKIDWSETYKRQEKEAEKVSPIKGEVKKGEIIVRAHDIVTYEVVEKLNAMPTQMIGITGSSTFIGRNLLYLLGVLSLVLILYFRGASILGEFGKLGLLLVLMSIVIVLTSVIIKVKASFYLLPIAMFGILAGLLLDREIGVAGVISLTIVIGVYSGGDFELLILSLVGGITGVLASTTIKKPSDFPLPLTCIGGVYVFTALGIELIKLSPFSQLIRSVGYACIGGVGGGFLAFSLLPVFEKMFKITTPLTLLEYANPEHQLLRDLAMYAPGTYHHSMAVATISEGIARAVGADPLLTRVGAYYHDIGKLRKPGYFIENQHNTKENPKITPELNARVIISHVREGVEIGVKEKLPREVINIISEHHGTTKVESLYLKAKNSSQNVDELDFTYPGPLPHSKESAIVMLADSIEATIRGIPHITPFKIKNIVHTVIENKLKEGQLSMVNMSMREIKEMEERFVPILIAMCHQRILQNENRDKENDKEKDQT